MTGPPTDGGASERAKEAATRACATTEQWIQIAADAMHDSALGLDRSVRLGAVVEALRDPSDGLILMMVRTMFDPHINGPNMLQEQAARNDLATAADFIVREFSEGDHHGQ